MSVVFACRYVVDSIVSVGSYGGTYCSASLGLGGRMNRSGREEE